MSLPLVLIAVMRGRIVKGARLHPGREAVSSGFGVVHSTAIVASMPGILSISGPRPSIRTVTMHIENRASVLHIIFRITGKSRMLAEQQLSVALRLLFNAALCNAGATCGADTSRTKPWAG
jgi:hypothetical protein